MANRCARLVNNRTLFLTRPFDPSPCATQILPLQAAPGAAASSQANAQPSQVRLILFSGPIPTLIPPCPAFARTQLIALRPCFHFGR